MAEEGGRAPQLGAGERAEGVQVDVVDGMADDIQYLCSSVYLDLREECVHIYAKEEDQLHRSQAPDDLHVELQCWM